MNEKSQIKTPKYSKLSYKERFSIKFRNKLARSVHGTYFQFRIYRSYWHYKFFKRKLKESKKEQFLTQKSDYGAGIGHQLSNWNTGYYLADIFGLTYAHTPFSSPKWESFLGFGENEIHVSELKGNVTNVRLPRFNLAEQREVDLIKMIINSYNGKKVLFHCEINQGYQKQFETAKAMSRKFHNAIARKENSLIFEINCVNIAVHIRRRMDVETDSIWKMRGLDNSYFAKVLQTTIDNINADKKINIYFFSQGQEEDFPEFSNFDNFHFCLDMDPYNTFLHMAKADLLISSKSSFSYKPALINEGIKICPETFWHSYPDAPDYILADNQGEFDIDKLKKALEK